MCCKKPAADYVIWFLFRFSWFQLLVVVRGNNITITQANTQLFHLKKTATLVLNTVLERIK